LIEPSTHEPCEPVLLLEVGCDKRDPGRVDGGLREHLALDRLCLWGIDLEGSDLPVRRQSQRAGVEACAKEDKLCHVGQVPVYHSVEKRHAGCGLVLSGNVTLERIPENPGHVACQTVSKLRRGGCQTHAQRRDARQHHHQLSRWLIFPGTQIVHKPASRQRPLRAYRDPRPAPSEDSLANPDHVTDQREREQKDADSVEDRDRHETLRRDGLVIIFVHS